MRSGRGVSLQGPCQADGTMLVVKNCFLEVVDVDSGLARSKSDGNLRSAIGGGFARVDAAQDACDNAAERLVRVDEVGSHSGTDTSHESLPEYASVTSGSRSSWWELSEGSERKSNGCGFSEGSQYESSGSSAWGAGSSQSENTVPRLAEEREDAERQQAEWLKGNEDQQRQHAAGACRPCLYHKTKAGCVNGAACGFCHLPHARPARRARPSKAERTHCKLLVAMMDGMSEGDADAADRLADISEPRDSRGNPSKYMLSILKARDRQRHAAPGGPTQAAAGGWNAGHLPGCG